MVAGIFKIVSMKKQYTPTKELIGFPIEILEKIEEMQISQGQEPNVEVIDRDIYAHKLKGGFTWSDTIQILNIPKEFWSSVLIKRNFDLFFKHFPKNNNIPVKKSNEVKRLKFKTFKK